MFGDAVPVVERGLRPPADVERRADAALRPVHDAAELRPVAYLLEGQVLHRGTRDDEAVGTVGLEGVDVGVVAVHVGLRGGLVALSPDFHGDELHPLAASAEHAGEVEFRDGLLRHQVEQQDAQRTHSLRRGRRQDGTLAAERFGRRQSVRQDQGHGAWVFYQMSTRSAFGTKRGSFSVMPKAVYHSSMCGRAPLTRQRPSEWGSLLV